MKKSSLSRELVIPGVDGAPVIHDKNGVCWYLSGYDDSIPASPGVVSKDKLPCCEACGYVSMRDGESAIQLDGRGVGSADPLDIGSVLDGLHSGPPVFWPTPTPIPPDDDDDDDDGDDDGDDGDNGSNGSNGGNGSTTTTTTITPTVTPIIVYECEYSYTTTATCDKTTGNISFGNMTVGMHCIAACSSIDWDMIDSNDTEDFVTCTYQKVVCGGACTSDATCALNPPAPPSAPSGEDCGCGGGASCEHVFEVTYTYDKESETGVFGDVVPIDSDFVDHLCIDCFQSEWELADRVETDTTVICTYEAIVCGDGCNTHEDCASDESEPPDPPDSVDCGGPEPSSESIHPRRFTSED